MGGRESAPRDTLPDPHHVAPGIAEGCDPEVALGIRRRDHLAALGHELVNRLVNVLDVDVRAHSGLAGDSHVRQEVPDDVTGGVLKASAARIAVYAPSEHELVKRCRLSRVLSGNA